MIIYNEGDDVKFLKDTIRQLKSGLTCYAFTLEQVEAVRKEYKKKTKLDLKVEKSELGYMIKPLKKISESIVY